MDSYFLVYLWTRLDTIHGITLFFLIASIAISIIFFISVAMEKDFAFYRNEKEIAKAKLNSLKKRIPKFLIIVLCITLPIMILIPSKKDVATIYVLPKVANHSSIEEWNKVLNTMPKVVLQFLEEFVPDKENKK